jgi:hypothetical protein
LLRTSSRTVGRLDSPFVGIDVDDLAANPEFDAADAAISGAYIGALNSYLFGTLRYKTRLSYRPNFYKEIAPAWIQSHRAPGGSGERPVAAAIWRSRCAPIRI